MNMSFQNRYYYFTYNNRQYWYAEGSEDPHKELKDYDSNSIGVKFWLSLKLNETKELTFSLGGMETKINVTKVLMKNQSGTNVFMPLVYYSGSKITNIMAYQTLIDFMNANIIFLPK